MDALDESDPKQQQFKELIEDVRAKDLSWTDGPDNEGSIPYDVQNTMFEWDATFPGRSGVFRITEKFNLTVPPA